MRNTTLKDLKLFGMSKLDKKGRRAYALRFLYKRKMHKP